MEQSSSNAVPFSIMGIVKGAWPILKKNAVNLIGLVGGLTVFASLLGYALTWILVRGRMITLAPSSMGGMQITGISGMGILLILVFLIVIVVAGLLVQLMTIKLVHEQIHGNMISLTDALNFAKTRAVPVILTGLLMAVLTAGPYLLSFLIMFTVSVGLGGFLAFCSAIWMIAVGIYWMFSIFETALGSTQYMEALNASKKIVQNRWWKTLGYMFVFGLLAGIATAIVNIFAMIPMLGMIISLAGSAVIGTYVMVVYILFYTKMKETVGQVPTAPAAPTAPSTPAAPTA